MYPTINKVSKKTNFGGLIWCANDLRHVLPKCKINLKLTISFGHVSIFFCVVKKSGKICRSRENRDKIKFGAQFPSKHDNHDRMHQITLHYKRNGQNIQILLLFSRQLRFANLPFSAIFQGQYQKIVSFLLICNNSSLKLLKS